MKIRSIILVILITIFGYINTYSQITFSFSIGTSKHSMTELKDFNNYIIDNLPVNAKIVDNFPFTPFYECNLLYNFNKIFIGVSYSYHSTGSRISYIDYSGEIKIDQIISSNTIGPIVKYNFYKTGNFRYLSFISIKYQSTSYKISDYSRIYEFEESGGEKFSSQSAISNLGVEVLYLYKNYGITAFIGFTLDFTGNFKFDGRDEFNPDWSGISLGLRFSYDFKFAKHKE
jgi:hypothetical protein